MRRRHARQRGAGALTYRQIAAMTGLPVSTVGDYFAGRTLPPTDRFDALVRLFGAETAEQGALATLRDRVEERRRRNGAVADGGRRADPVPDLLRVRLSETPTVGRRAELDVLSDAITNAGRGRGGAVLIVGEAGIGKTRLLRETERTARDAGMVVPRGRASSPATQFRPLAEALFSVIRRTGIPDEPELAPYRSALSRLVPECARRRLPGVDDSLVVLAEAVLRLCARLGRDRGCVVLLDDLHDADDDTLDVVDYLVDNAAGAGVLVVGTSRPEPGRALNIALAARRRGVATVLELPQLDEQAVRLLAAGCLGVAAESVPDEVLGQLVREAEGNPFYVEELLAGMLSEQRLVRSGDGWRSTGEARAAVPTAVLGSVTARVERLGPLGMRVLRPASLLGPRFTAAVVGSVAELAETDVLTVLRDAVGAHLVVVDESGCYSFRHALTVEALRAGLLPEERIRLCHRAARAIENAYPGLPDHWCAVAGELWWQGGQPRRAAEMFGRAGRRAAAQGAVGTSIRLLERGLSLLQNGHSGWPAGAAGLLEALLDVLIVAGQLGRASELGARLDSRADPERRAAVHLRLARAAAAADQWRTGRRELDIVRELVGDEPGPRVVAQLDAVAAQLAFADPTPDRLARAEELAERALRAAVDAALPEIACESLEVLGTCARIRDLAESDALFDRALTIADRHGLTLWRVRLLFQIGAQDAIRSADPTRLVEARATALRAGAVVTALDIAAELAVVHLTRGEYEEAERYATDCEDAACRLQLGELPVIALGIRICAAAHQGRRSEVDERFAEYERRGGRSCDFTSAVLGFGLAFCSLLEEDRARAAAELRAAVVAAASRPPQYLSFTHGLRLFLAVLAGTEGRPECEALLRSAHGNARWNRQFLMLAQAVLAGRDGDAAGAEQAVRQFQDLAAPYPLTYHLGLRFLAEAAIDDGWGQPGPWLRAAERYFHAARAPRVAAASRILLRRAGEPVPQRRPGTESIPLALRDMGITVREYEVLTLLAARLTNREIGQRLFLSARTVETHVANLLAKTGQSDRAALAGYAAAYPNGESP